MSVEKHILSDESMKAMRDKWHKDCVVCGETGMEIKHTVSSADCLETEFFCHKKFNGYNDRLHGGIITTLMDSAMTNCLFAAGIAAVTGELKVRFLKGVVLGKNVLVKARITNHKSPLFILESEMYQDGLLKCRAKARFMKIN